MPVKAQFLTYLQKAFHDALNFFLKARVNAKPLL